MDKKEPFKPEAAKQAEPAKPAAQASQKKEEPSQKQEAGMEHKLAGLTDQLLRIHAEFDNYKKRTAKEKQELVHSSEAKLMLRMIPVYEEIELAQKEVAKLPEGELKKGVLLVLSKLRASFEKEGLQEMKLEGEKFDPYRHDCALQEDSEKPDGEIVKVIQQGYTFRGEVLRHAVVSISSGKKEDKSTATGETKDGDAKKA